MAIYIHELLPRPRNRRNPLTLHTDPAQPPGLPRTVRLGIVDDHEVFRMGLRSLLSRAPRVEIVWDAASAHDAFERLQLEPVDAVLMDVNLGGPVDGIEATDRMMGAWPALKVILISGLADERRLLAAGQAGAAGFLPKELGADEMVEAIVRMVVGTSPRPGVGLRPAGQVLGPASGEPPLHAFESLSPREMEVLGEVRWARTNREIAARLGVSTSTVNKHVHQILRKLGLRNRAEAAVVAGKLLSRPRHVL
jgi:DNA-binding NarL/FixJ family response regulator